MSLPLLLAVMILATYRLTRLIVKDTFPPVLWVRDRLVGGWRPWEEPDGVAKRQSAQLIGEVPNIYVARSPKSPYWLAELLSCPWSASGWVSLVITLTAATTIGVPAPLLVWPAVWAGGALIAAQSWA